MSELDQIVEKIIKQLDAINKQIEDINAKLREVA